MPGLLMIGSNGGNAVFGLDLRDPDTTAYVETDFVPMNWDHTVRARRLPARVPAPALRPARGRWGQRGTGQRCMATRLPVLR